MIRDFILVFLILGSISSAAFGQELEIIDLGAPAQRVARLPDPEKTGSYILLKPEQRIDILVLADGYTEIDRPRFNRDIATWHERFSSLSPFRELRSAFRVRAVWTPGKTWASPAGTSRFHTGISADNSIAERIPPEFSKALFSVLDGMEMNRRVFPGTKRYSNVYVAMLVKSDAGGGTPGGRPLLVPSPDGKRVVSASLGEDSLHEFGHAFAFLSDEYIPIAESAARPKIYPSHSLWDENYFPALHNVSRTPVGESLPWKHLAPGSSLNPTPQSLIGVLWSGGEFGEFGNWHSEARCLMNGGHENWDLAKKSRGGWLRDVDRFCFWCEEINAAWIYYLTGQLGDTEDGEGSLKKWEKLRTAYYSAFHVKERINEKNLSDQAASLAKSPLWTSPAFEVSGDPSFLTGMLLVNTVLDGALMENKGLAWIEPMTSRGDLWIIEGDPKGFVRIKNSKTDHYLNLEEGMLTCSKIHSGAWSSHWLLYSFDGESISFINRWEGLVLAVEAGRKVICRALDPALPGPGRWQLLKPTD